MSRNFGMKMLTMTNLSTECLIQLTKLGYDATPFNQILKQNAKREMRLRLGKVTVADVLAAQPVTTNLLKFMRASIKMIGDRKSGSAGMPRPISYAVFCLKKKSKEKVAHVRRVLLIIAEQVVRILGLRLALEGFDDI